MNRLLPLASLLLFASISLADPLPNTQPLTWTDDIASRMIDGIDKLLQNQIEPSTAPRQRPPARAAHSSTTRPASAGCAPGSPWSRPAARWMP